MKFLSIWFSGMCFLILLVACNTSSPSEVEQLTIEVIQTYPHDETAFTQGLEFYNSDLLESTGLYGQSSLRRVDEETGTILEKTDRIDAYFAEGITVAENNVYQLTWKAEKVFVQPLKNFDADQQVQTFSYEGEGWGLCYDGTLLVRSDGTDKLHFHEPETFAEKGSKQIMLAGEPLKRLNELECVDGFIWANIFQSNQIAKIDPITGQVIALADATALVNQNKENVEEVLNGIAYNHQSETFWITGKQWDTLYEVKFLPNS